jgi:hypothetical protein
MNHRRLTTIWPGPAVAATLLLAGGAAAAAPDDDGPPSVALESPVEGTSVAGGVELEMTAGGITIEAAGEVHDGAGHFHVIADAGCLAAGESIVRDADHVHFGRGQDEGVIYLEPGTHELCLQVGDGIHTALDITDQVAVEVGITSLDEWCDVIGEVDELFEVMDTSEDEFAVLQIGYENIRRLIAQLDDGLDHLPAGARDDLDATLDFVTEFVTALTTAEDEATAYATVDSLFTGIAAGEELPGSEWVAERCDVDVNG